MVTLQPSGAASTDLDPLLVSTPPSGAGPGAEPGPAPAASTGAAAVVLVEASAIGANGGSISVKCRRGRLSLRSRSPRGPPPPPAVTAAPPRRPSPPTLLIRSATADCMGSPPGVDTVVTITDTEQVRVAIASPKNAVPLRTTPDLRIDFFSELIAQVSNKHW
jgi:hypothetical protein